VGELPIFDARFLVLNFEFEIRNLVPRTSDPGLRTLILSLATALLVPSWCKLWRMLFMVIEHFKPGSMALIDERFQRSGRMLPEGVSYHASWVEPAGARCFQIMEAANPEMLQP